MVWEESSCPTCPCLTTPTSIGHPVEESGYIKVSCFKWVCFHYKCLWVERGPVCLSCFHGVRVAETLGLWLNEIRWIISQPQVPYGRYDLEKRTCMLTGTSENNCPYGGNSWSAIGLYWRVWEGPIHKHITQWCWHLKNMTVSVRFHQENRTTQYFKQRVLNVWNWLYK